MKNRFLLSAFLLSSFLLFSFCSAAKKSTKSAEVRINEIRITAEDSGKTVHLKTGDRFCITFGECIGCAEEWAISAIDDEKIERLPNTYSGNSCKKCDGGSQSNTFHFRATAPGESVLSFRYFQQRFTVTIAVE